MDGTRQHTHIVNSLLNAAASHFSSGLYRDSYNDYLKAANAALVLLMNSVAWSNEDVTAKPDNASEIFKLAHQSLTRAEEILRARHVITIREQETPFVSNPVSADSVTAGANVQISGIPGFPLAQGPHGIPPPSLGQAHVASIGSTPLIPLSTLARHFVQHSQQLAVARARYVTFQNQHAAEDDNRSTTRRQSKLATLRRLIEDVQIQKSKVDDISEKIESVVVSPVTRWEPEELAMQITILDAALFSKVDPRANLNAIVQQDRTLPPELKACLDFHVYVERIMIDAILSQSRYSKKLHSAKIAAAGTTHIEQRHASDLTSHAKPIQAQSLAIRHVIYTAFILFYVYRNISGFAALMKALNSPEIRRLGRSMENLPPKAKDLLKHLRSVFSPEFENSGREHMDLMTQILQHHFQGGGTIAAIPWLHPFVSEVKDITNAYLAGHQIVSSDAHIPDNVQDASSTTVVLSDIGARALEEVILILELCKGMGKLDLPPPQPSHGSSRTPSSSSPGSRGKDIGTLDVRNVVDRPLPRPPDDLQALGLGELPLEHWILTRVFWTHRDLWYRSADFESPAPGETCPYQDTVDTEIGDEVHLATSTGPAEMASTPKIDDEITLSPGRSTHSRDDRGVDGGGGGSVIDGTDLDVMPVPSGDAVVEEHIHPSIPAQSDHGSFPLEDAHDKLALSRDEHSTHEQQKEGKSDAASMERIASTGNEGDECTVEPLLPGAAGLLSASTSQDVFVSPPELSDEDLARRRSVGASQNEVMLVDVAEGDEAGVSVSANEMSSTAHADTLLGMASALLSTVQTDLQPHDQPVDLQENEPEMEVKEDEVRQVLAEIIDQAVVSPDRVTEGENLGPTVRATPQVDTGLLSELGDADYLDGLPLSAKEENGEDVQLEKQEERGDIGVFAARSENNGTPEVGIDDESYAQELAKRLSLLRK
ncbi:hypothetical protein HK102_010792 [Quaeritorhiza haematococci]|nr:hypothetical protein HK102_010792 [Quaeritorhiza haematococci]